MTQATFNQVSHCCNRGIVVQLRTEYPLGGRTWGLTYDVDVCECCGQDCSPVDQCEVCGVVGCAGCDIIQAEEERLRMMGIVDISEVEE